MTFGLIVLNGEPFTRYLLRAIYPFAQEIIAVEGAAPAARAIATPDGHSNDGTLAVLRDFQTTEDPEQKLTVVTAEDHGYRDGFWPGEKHEQSQAYAQRATGDYLWQVDVDEFYLPADMARVVEMLAADPTITLVSFPQITFWGGFDYWADSWYLHHVHTQTHRVFKWGKGYSYKTHRPPIITDGQGRDLRSMKWIQASNPALMGVCFYHYSLVFPKQVMDKSKYYGRAEWAQAHEEEQWAGEAYFALRRPYRVHNVYDYPSWLDCFAGEHPPEIERLRADLRAGKVAMTLRPTDDIERLLQSRSYGLGRAVLRRTTGLAVTIPFLLIWRARLASLRRDPRRAIRRFFRRLKGQPL